MSASENPDGRRGGRGPTVVLWIGIVLAPVAALLILVGSGTGSSRFALFLLVLAVVLVGIGSVLRADGNKVRAEVEDMVVEEIDGLRGDIRKDITTAARATHKAFSEKLQGVNRQLESVRGQITAGIAPQAVGPGPVGP